jgi:acetyl-CoA acetyltransferase
MESNTSHRDRCAISGIGVTDFSNKSGRSTLTLAAQASLAAIADAGLEVSDIDGIVRCDMDQVQHNDLADAIGVGNLTYWAATGAGGGAPCGMVGQAVAAVLSGMATNVIVYRSLNGRSGRRFGGGGRSLAERVGGNNSYDEYFSPFGLLAPGQMWSLIAQRHMIEFGTTQEQLGAIALACRENANRNPAAQMHGRELTMEDYLSSRIISAPLHLYDYCLETDGAAAVIVTSTERAKDAPSQPAVIRAVAQGAPFDLQGGIASPSLMREIITTQPSASVAATLYARAGMGPDDIQVAQFYDCFTPTTLVQLEDYGFCAKGEGGPFAESGAIRAGGRLPINTAGGNLSEGYIHGLNHVVEGVRQIRGGSTNQVPGAQVCLVTSGIPIASSALILTAA